MTEPTASECVLHKVHHPSVAVLHNVTIDGDVIPVCGTGLDNLIECMAYMRGSGPSPQAKIGRPTWDLAQRAIASQSAVLPSSPRQSV